MQLAEAMAADSAIRHGDDPGDLGIAGEARDRCPAVDRLDTRLDGVVAEEENGLYLHLLDSFRTWLLIVRVVNHSIVTVLIGCYRIARQLY